MALTADGWHMATHVGALGMASVAYAFARRFASHHAFAFGTGKVHALAGYTSAVALGLVALVMMAESISRLVHPSAIDFASSLPVAVVGLGVNLLSIRLLHGHEDEDAHETGKHDHNHRAAVIHVMADALTSALAIGALLAGRWLGWGWCDPVTGIVGGLVILKWGGDLCRRTASELIDFDPDFAVAKEIRASLEQIDDVRVRDLHVWSMGSGKRSCIVTLVSSEPRETQIYREHILARAELAHLTVEVHRCVARSEMKLATGAAD
jgi:cation diffusion facilitator family transporter